MFFIRFIKNGRRIFALPTNRLAIGGLLRPERSSFGAQYAVFCAPKSRVLEMLRHCADTLIYILRLHLSPACRKGRVKSGCLQHVKHWRMRDLTGFIGILLPASMLRVIDTKHTRPVYFYHKRQRHVRRQRGAFLRFVSLNCLRSHHIDGGIWITLLI